MQLETIVIVDDEDSILRELGAILRRKGYEVLNCTNSQTALIVIESVTPQLIIADLLMKSMNGFELCERVHALPGLSHTPIVLMSTQANFLPIPDQASCLCSFLTKPIQPDELLSLVAGILPGRQVDSVPAAMQAAHTMNKVMSEA